MIDLKDTQREQQKREHTRTRTPSATKAETNTSTLVSQRKTVTRGADADGARPIPPLSLVSEIARFLGSAMGIAIANRKNRCDFGALRDWKFLLKLVFCWSLFSLNIPSKEARKLRQKLQPKLRQKPNCSPPQRKLRPKVRSAETLCKQEKTQKIF